MLKQTDLQYNRLLSRIFDDGKPFTCRGHRTKEVLNSSIKIPMSEPLVTCKERKLGYRFTCAEAAWIMSGDNRVSTIRPYAKMIEKFSDDGIFYFGAYGPKIVEQLPYIIKCFKRDIFTRQAIIQIWRERPYVTNDVPCTISVQFLYRDGKLHCIDNMRSSDAWLGVPYDWFNFSMLSAGVAILLRNSMIEFMDIKLGDLYFNAGSQHIYLDKKSFGYDADDVANVIYNMKSSGFDYRPINLGDFNSYDDLVATLWKRANNEYYTESPWLSELDPKKRGQG